MPSLTPKNIRRFEGFSINAMGLLLLFLMTVPLFPTFAALEGRLYPVARTAEILSVEADGKAGSIVKMRFTLTRSCKFEHVTWSRLLSDGSREAVRVDYGTPLGSRGEGTHVSQEWRVAMTPDDLKHNSIAFVWHDCHPFWSVISQFYP